MQDRETEPVFITEIEASKLTSMSRGWFARCRWAGDGPEFIKLAGKVLYDRQKLLEFFRTKSRRSTSEKPVQNAG